MDIEKPPARHPALAFVVPDGVQAGELILVEFEIPESSRTEVDDVRRITLSVPVGSICGQSVEIHKSMILSDQVGPSHLNEEKVVRHVGLFYEKNEISFVGKILALSDLAENLFTVFSFSPDFSFAAVMITFLVIDVLKAESSFLVQAYFDDNFIATVVSTILCEAIQAVAFMYYCRFSLASIVFFCVLAVFQVSTNGVSLYLEQMKPAVQPDNSFPDNCSVTVAESAGNGEGNNNKETPLVDHTSQQQSNNEPPVNSNESPTLDNVELQPESEDENNFAKELLKIFAARSFGQEKNEDDDCLVSYSSCCMKPSMFAVVGVISGVSFSLTSPDSPFNSLWFQVIITFYFSYLSFELDWLFESLLVLYLKEDKFYQEKIMKSIVEKRLFPFYVVFFIYSIIVFVIAILYIQDSKKFVYDYFLCIMSLIGGSSAICLGISSCCKMIGIQVEPDASKDENLNLDFNVDQNLDVNLSPPATEAV